MAIRFNDLPCHERQRICQERLEPYDALPPAVRKAVRETKWGAATLDLAHYVGRLAWGASEESIIVMIQHADQMSTRRLYRNGIINEGFGDGHT